MKALLAKMTSPARYSTRSRSFPAASGSASSLTVDQRPNLYQLVQVAFALKSPSDHDRADRHRGLPTPAGVAVLWDRAQAHQLFSDLNADRKVPQQPDHRLEGRRRPPDLAPGRARRRTERPACNGAYPVRPPATVECRAGKIIRAHPAAAGSPCCPSGKPEV